MMLIRKCHFSFKAKQEGQHYLTVNDNVFIKRGGLRELRITFSSILMNYSSFFIIHHSFD